MKLSERTVNILKNFATIYPSVLLKAGQEQVTFDPVTGGILAEVRIDEDLPQDFAIWDLSQFLGNLTALNDPELTFENEKLILEDSQVKLNYYGAEPKLIKTPPSKLVLKPENIDVSFGVMEDDFQKVLKLASINSLPHITFFSDDGKEVFMKLHDKANDTSNFLVMKVLETVKKIDPFKITLKIENIKIIPGTYNFDIALGKFARLTNVDGTLMYFIAMEKDNGK